MAAALRWFRRTRLLRVRNGKRTRELSTKPVEEDDEELAPPFHHSFAASTQKTRVSVISSEFVKENRHQHQLHQQISIFGYCGSEDSINSIILSA
ncbi:hypothetical protein SDJN03_20592, partial [Cucurbita argyrosperma subsp. sororia]